MKISQFDIENLTDKQRTELLFDNIEDDFQKGDCIFVPGSSKATVYRLPKAVQLYKEKRACKILFSGGVVWDDSNNTEAEALKKKAIELGIPSEDLLVENISTHTKENVIASLLVLDRVFGLHNIKRLILVTSTYHMRRLHLNMKTYMPPWIEYSFCPVDDETTKRDNWYKFTYGRERVETESIKLIKYVKNGYICDAEIMCEP